MFRSREPRYSLTKTVRAITFFVTLCATAAHAQSLSDTVAQFYPQSLIDLNQEIFDEPPFREQCFGVLETYPSGAPRTVLAAYTDHRRVGAVVRVLRHNGSGFAVASEPSGFDFDGSECTISVTNLNNDGNPDAILTFPGERNSVVWLFSWDGQTLTNLSPTEATDLGTFLSELRNAAPVDLNGDGIQEISSRWDQSAGEPLLPNQIYRWESGRYELDRQVVGPWVFKADSSYTYRIPFDLPPSAQGPFLMKVVNGTAAAGTRVRNGRIWLNGQEVFGPNDFGANVAALEKGVTFQADNEIAVLIAGPPEREITIFIEAAGWSAPWPTCPPADQPTCP